MDPTMPLKLPRYMFRRANGSFRYKRNVPKDLRTVIPKATIYRQLGNTYQDALWALPKVHAEIEALFDRERRTTDEQRARELVRERLGERHKSMFIEGAVDPEWPEFDDFQELAEDVDHSVPKGVTKQLRAASSTPAPMSLSRVLEEYFAYKAEEADTGLRTRVDRIRKDLILCLGKNRFEWTELKDLTRSDANPREMAEAQLGPLAMFEVVDASSGYLNVAEDWGLIAGKNCEAFLKAGKNQVAQVSRIPTRYSVSDIDPVSRSKRRLVFIPRVEEIDSTFMAQFVEARQQVCAWWRNIDKARSISAVAFA
jgi:head-tail adaptor